MAHLREMIVDGRVSGVMTWADGVRAADARCAGFADEVHAAARHLDFPKLKSLAQT